MLDMTHIKKLKLLLYAGSVYFACVALVHAAGLKIPGLFVYFNVPSYAYQDRIISFLAFGWASFFWLAAKQLNPDQIKVILFIGMIANLALLINSLITDFSIMDASIKTSYFLIINLALFIYWLSLVFYSWEYLTQKK